MGSAEDSNGLKANCLRLWAVLIFIDVMLLAFHAADNVADSKVGGSTRTIEILALSATALYTWPIRHWLKEEIPHWLFHENYAPQRTALFATVCGIVLGPCALFLCYSLGAIPEVASAEFTQPVPFNEWLFLAAIGAVLGGTLALHFAKRRYPKELKYDPIVDAAVVAACWGAGLGAGTTILWNAIAYGSYDARATIGFLSAAALFMMPVGAWIGAARRGMYERTRLIVSAGLSVLVAVSILLLSLSATAPSKYWQSLADSFPWLFSDSERTFRVIVAAGTVIGLAFWASWQFKSRVYGRRYALTGTGRVIDNVNDFLSRLILFIVGALKFAVGGPLVWFAWRHWSGLTLLEGVLWVVAIGILWSGIKNIREALRMQPRMKNLNPHGNADLASERKATDYEQGTGGRTTAHDRRF
jgi:hypothetical protein